MKTKTGLGSFHIFLALVLMFGLFCAWAEGRPRFRIIDLGPFPDGSEPLPCKINNLGEVVGQVIVGGRSSDAFIYSGGVVRILEVGVDGGAAYDINDTGQVVGIGVTLPRVYAFLYDRGTVIDLNALTGRAFAAAEGINNAGMIVGNINQTNILGSVVRSDGAMISSSGEVTLFNPLPGGHAAYVRGINNRGQAVGNSSIPGDVPGFFDVHPVIFVGSNTFDLGNPSTGTRLNGIGIAINDSGEAVGLANTGADFYGHAFLFREGRVTFLGELAGDVESFASDINNDGDVVGQSTDVSYNHRAFLYANGVLYDLNFLIPPKSGWFLDAAYGINDLGQIVGFGHHNGAAGAFLLTPVKKHRSK